MGNSFYRPIARRTHSTEEGSDNYYNYGVSQITGWRFSQEDRFICIRDFFKNFSFFGVYDGHGGSEVAQYLQRYLHQYVLRQLELTEDIELALYLGFLSCDMSLRYITNTERDVIEADLENAFEVADQEERRAVISEYTSIFMGASAKSINDGAESSRAIVGDSVSIPGPSRAFSLDNKDEIRSAVMSACAKEFPALHFLTKAPIAKESDESDEDFEPEKGNIKRNIFKTDNPDESEESSEMECSESSELGYSESYEKEMEDLTMGILEAHEESTGESNKANSNDEKNLETKNNPDACSTKPPDDFLLCGSTATVVLLSTHKIFVASVGDSRCVACIGGHAVDLSFDHNTTVDEEAMRITNAGGTISSDGRVNGLLDLTRSFGDFAYKQKVGEPNQIISWEPHITTLDFSPDLEFIIIASDGIWNTWDSEEVIQYIKRRFQDTTMELRDICGEMFEEMLPVEITEDGSGCDNMTAILIKFEQKAHKSAFCVKIQESFKYKYPPQQKDSEDISTTEIKSDEKSALEENLVVEHDENSKKKNRNACASHSDSHNMPCSAASSSQHYKAGRASQHPIFIDLVSSDEESDMPDLNRSSKAMTTYENGTRVADVSEEASSAKVSESDEETGDEEKVEGDYEEERAVEQVAERGTEEGDELEIVEAYDDSDDTTETSDKTK